MAKVIGFPQCSPKVSSTGDGGGKPPSGGRPRKKVNIEEFRALAERGATNEEIAAYFGVSPRTIERRRRLKAYEDAFQTGRAACSLRVRTWIFESAASGQIAARIFLAKAICGMSDKVQLVGKDDGPIMTATAEPDLSHLSDDELESLRNLLAKGSANPSKG